MNITGGIIFLWVTESMHLPWTKMLVNESNWGCLQFWTLMKFFAYILEENIYLSAWVNSKINHNTISDEIYNPEFNLPIRIKGKYRKFVWKVSVIVRIFEIYCAQEKFGLIWFWVRVRWVNVYFYLRHWFLWVTTTGSLLQLHFAHRLLYAEHCQCRWELVQNLWELIWDCLLHCLLSCSLRLVWNCVPGLCLCQCFLNECLFLESLNLRVP